MDDRREIGKQLQNLEKQLRELQIRYEKYFSGAEKLEPLKQREDVFRLLRHFANRRIVQTDLRFKYQNLATRYHTYAAQWDRIQRLMDEGKYVRHLSRSARRGSPDAGKPSGNDDKEVDALYEDLVQAHRSTQAEKRLPKRDQVANFLQKQKAKLKEKYGDREMQFQVVTEEGHPKIKVKARK